MKRRGLQFYGKLFLSTFQLSAFTFGGGYVIVPLMRKQFVDKLGWIEEKEMLDFTAIAQSSPGAMAVNASVMLGYHLAGIPGALVAVIGTVLPPLILLSIISMGYSAFITNTVVKNVLRGMAAGVCAVIIDVVAEMGGRVLGGKHITCILLMLGAFVAVALLKVDVVLVIFTCVLVGIMITAKHKPEKQPEEESDDLP